MQHQCFVMITEHGAVDDAVFLHLLHVERRLLLCDRYEWRRDGSMYTPSTMVPGSGTFTLTDPESSDEGVYQCFARNGVGTAMSNTTHAVLSTRASFPKRTVGQPVTARVGDKLRIDCQPDSRGTPLPDIDDYSWRDTDGRKWPIDPRVQTDDLGLLCHICTSF